MVLRFGLCFTSAFVGFGETSPRDKAAFASISAAPPVAKRPMQINQLRSGWIGSKFSPLVFHIARLRDWKQRNDTNFTNEF